MELAVSTRWFLIWWIIEHRLSGVSEEVANVLCCRHRAILWWSGVHHTSTSIAIVIAEPSSILSHEVPEVFAIIAASTLLLWTPSHLIFSHPLSRLNESVICPCSSSLLCKFYRCWAIIHPLTWATESLHVPAASTLLPSSLFSSEHTATDVFVEWSCYHTSAICSVASHHSSSHLSRRNWLS